MYVIIENVKENRGGGGLWYNNIMATHSMRLQEKYFNFIKSGTKRIELRLFDEKRRAIQAGDEIVFSKNNDDGERLHARVVELLKCPTFKDLFADYDIEILADKSMTKEELMDALNEFYSEEKQKEYSVVGIKFEL